METRNHAQPGGDAKITSAAPPNDHARAEKFVTFKLGGNYYAVLAAMVAEVTHPLPLTALPNRPPGILGISPLRGEILATLDARRILGLPASSVADPKSKQIVLKRSSPDAVTMTFAVDRVGEIAALDISQIRPAPADSEFIIGESEFDGRPIKVIDNSRLAAAAAEADFTF